MSEVFASLFRLSTPLIFAALGGLFCERSGVATICLEGVMLTAAWTAATINFTSHNPWLGLICGVIVGTATMSVHAFLCLKAKADAIISGVAVNILAAGLTPFLSKILFGSPTNTPSVPLDERFRTWAVPGLSDVPFFVQPPLVFLAFLLPFLVHYVLYKTPWGLHVLAAGDGPGALRTAGISPNRTRLKALLVGGALASLGGIYLSISHGSQFTRDMTAGRGFIALTALIFGKWRPIPTFFACLLFGLTDTLQIQLQGTILFGVPLPVQLISAVPYVVTLVVLAGFIGKARPPLAIGTRLD